jgi:hypothetical protein
VRIKPSRAVTGITTRQYQRLVAKLDGLQSAVTTLSRETAREFLDGRYEDAGRLVAMYISQEMGVIDADEFERGRSQVAPFRDEVDDALVLIADAVANDIRDYIPFEPDTSGATNPPPPNTEANADLHTHHIRNAFATHVPVALRAMGRV